jgi:hypothetical protein
MRALTTFNVKLYPIQHAQGAEEAVERVHESHFQEDGNFVGGVVTSNKISFFTLLIVLRGSC